MTTDNILAWIATLGAIAFAGWTYYKAGKKPASVEESAEAMDEGLKQIVILGKQLAAAAGIAQGAVSAAQQLWDSEQIPKTAEGELDSRFAYVYDIVKSAVPGLTETQYEMTVEAAVYWLKQATKALTTLQTSEESTLTSEG